MQAQVRLIAAGLIQRGWSVSIAVGGGDLEPVAGVTLIELPTFAGRWGSAYTRALRSEVRRLQPSVVHGHGLRLALPLRRLRHRATWVTCHGLDPLQVATTAKLVRWSRTPVIACGTGPRDLLSRYGLTSTVINNALTPPIPRSSEELRARFGLDPERPVIVFPARFSDQKNHRALLSALRAVRLQLGESAPYVLCFGDGPLRQEIERESLVDGSEPLLRCYDFSPEAPGWIGASDFFVLPSRWEGQPLVVLEALASNRAVVTLTPGVDDLVYDGINGVRVDSVARLAEVIVTWCREPESKPVDPVTNLRLCHEHSVDVVLDAYLTLYEGAARP